MAKNDFDIDFDFEKEYGFDPDAMGSEYTQDDFDFSELGEEYPQEEALQEEDDFSDFNLDDLDLYDENAEDFDLSFEEDNAPEEELPAPEDTEAAALEKAARAELFRWIHSLPTLSREVVYLRLAGELSFAEIGGILGRSENWARVTFYRAKLLLKGDEQ